MKAWKDAIRRGIFKKEPIVNIIVKDLDNSKELH